MTQRLTLGFTSCPNDVFIFQALVARLIKMPELDFEPVIEDVEALNWRARRQDLDMTKVSFHAFGHLRNDYVLLDSGAALGRGCGPIVVARKPIPAIQAGNLKIAIPGELTTAALLLRLWSPSLRDFEIMVFDQILDAVKEGRVDAGLIIHESRFTYDQLGLENVIDLGDWWERKSGLPIPLGGIIARRALGLHMLRNLNDCLRDSIEFAQRNRGAVWDTIREHAQELDNDVIGKHIDLYVNDFTLSLGVEGRQAVSALLEAAEAEGIIPTSKKSPFELD